MGQLGTIEVFTGPMFSGKSKNLIKRIVVEQHRGEVVQIFHPILDTRENGIGTHDGEKIDGTAISRIEDMLEEIAIDTTVIALDEAHLFETTIAEAEKIQFVSEELRRRGIKTLVVGLDTNFRGEIFFTMSHWFSQANEVRKHTATCAVCQADATRSQRIVDDESIVLVGDIESYEARCLEHHEVKK